MINLFSDKESTNAFDIIKHDHATVKDLFKQFEDAKDKRAKKKIVAQAIEELKIHAEIEEKLFYPAVRGTVEDDLMNEADEEHHVAKLLVAELDQLDASDDHWEAKFTVLAENIRHHIKEEEGEMLPQARKADVDFDALGAKIMDMKKQLKKNGVPECDEEKLMKARPKADSPAKAAAKKPKVVAKDVAKDDAKSASKKDAPKHKKPMKHAA